MDPTGKFLFVADLGSDSIRVFRTMGDKLEVMEQKAVSTGSGPRHLIFATPHEPQGDTLLYLVNELASTVNIYRVDYPATKHAHLDLHILQTDVSTLPKDQPTTDWLAAELILTPDRKHLIVSNRAPESPLPKDGTDLLTVFALDDKELIITGEDPTFVPVGGRGLRHMTLSPDGKYVAVICQLTNEIVVLSLGADAKLDEVARLKEFNQPTCIIWKQ